MKRTQAYTLTAAFGLLAAAAAGCRGEPNTSNNDLGSADMAGTEDMAMAVDMTIHVIGRLRETRAWPADFCRTFAWSAVWKPCRTTPPAWAPPM